MLAISLLLCKTLACILCFGFRLRWWRPRCLLLWRQAQVQGKAGPCWQQRSPEELEQLRPIDLLRAALPLQQLRYMLVRVEVPINAGW